MLPRLRRSWRWSNVRFAPFFATTRLIRFPGLYSGNGIRSRICDRKVRHRRGSAVRYGEGYGEGYGARCRRIREALEQGSKKGFRRYELRKIDGRLMLVRNEIDRFFGIAVSEVFGTELEPDDKDGMFLD